MNVSNYTSLSSLTITIGFLTFLTILTFCFGLGSILNINYKLYCYEIILLRTNCIASLYPIFEEI
jgi:hypothetical protein